MKMLRKIVAYLRSKPPMPYAVLGVDNSDA